MKPKKNSGFSALQIDPALLAHLDRHHIFTPTPIQAKAIPPALKGEDLIGIAQTGTGKTLAFALPILMRLKPNETALVLAPTRELAQQIAESFQKLHARTVLVVGGAGMYRQVEQLSRGCQVIVATPGRLLDHIRQRTVRLGKIRMVVLDEADRMLDMGFAPDIHRILDQTPVSRQTMLFSATMPEGIRDIANRHLKNPKTIELEPCPVHKELIEHEMIFVAHEEKPQHLAEILNENDGSVIVFARTRHGARKLATKVRENGHSAAEIHSDRTMLQRRTALEGFKKGTYRVLVATDIASRGIDVKDIALVVNYDVPESPEDYVHRTGRTGRAGRPGKAITLALAEQAKSMKGIEKLIGAEIPVSEKSTATPKRQAPSGPRSGPKPSLNSRSHSNHQNGRKPNVRKRSNRSAHQRGR